MRHTTLLELAAEHGIRLPDALRGGEPPDLEATDERGWFRFQRLYDAARAVVRTEADIRRLVLEAAEDDVAEGSGWLELQVDPTSYAPLLGGLTPTVELILDARRGQSRDGPGHGPGRRGQPDPAPARRADPGSAGAQYAGRGRGRVRAVQRRAAGAGRDFEHAFRIARGAGLAAVPHGGELGGPQRGRGPASTSSGRTGSGTGCGSSRTRGCWRSWPRPGDPGGLPDVQRRARGRADAGGRAAAGAARAGVPIALGADDPLLFGSRLVPQYQLAPPGSDGFSDLARPRSPCRAPDSSTAAHRLDAWLAIKAKLRGAGVVDWLA